MSANEDALSHAAPHAGTRSAGSWRRGLYLLTPDDADTQRLHDRVAPVLGHAALLQYRNKTADPALRRSQAAMLRVLCDAANVPLVVNDEPEVAHAAGASGVHLGEDDGDLATARKLLGGDAIIGVSCYDDLHAAERAVAKGADYVAFGAFFPSGTKPQQRRRADTGLLARAERLGVPRVAIGGITAENAGALVDAGADLVAVIAGVFDAPDPAAAARRIASLFD